jgi:hypothetical protein
LITKYIINYNYLNLEKILYIYIYIYIYGKSTNDSRIASPNCESLGRRIPRPQPPAACTPASARPIPPALPRPTGGASARGTTTRDAPAARIACDCARTARMGGGVTEARMKMLIRNEIVSVLCGTQNQLESQAMQTCY